MKKSILISLIILTISISFSSCYRVSTPPIYGVIDFLPSNHLEIPLKTPFLDPETQQWVYTVQCTDGAVIERITNDLRFIGIHNGLLQPVRGMTTTNQKVLGANGQTFTQKVTYPTFKMID